MDYYLSGVAASLSGMIIATLWLDKMSIPLQAATVRQASIEGPLGAFRGFLAFCVFLHHQGFMLQWLRSGQWICNNRLIIFLGHGSVFLFLMITAYVFWLKTNNARVNLLWWKFVVSRLRRLAPAYYFGLLLIFIQCTPALLKAPVLVSLDFLFRAMTVGFLPWSTVPNLHTVDINGHVHVILFYQWCFYLLIPSIGDKKLSGYRFFIPFSMISLVLLFAQRELGFSIWWLAFLPGVLIAQIKWSLPVRHAGVSWYGFVLALLWSILVLTLGGIRWMQFELLAVVPLFLVVICGNSFLGILKWTPFRILGQISYSFYLLHVIITMALLKVAFSHIDGSLLNILTWDVLMLLATILTVMLSAGCWRFLEEPFRKVSAGR